MALSRRHFLLGIGLAAGAGMGGLYRRARGAGGELLRPPGALAERAFLAACTRCGQCVLACPFGTLHLADHAAGAAVGTPYLVARDVPCYLCQGHDELLCTVVCPTLALEPVADLRAIRMGTAEIDHDRCLAFNGVVCRACWHVCPFPGAAIRFDERLRPVIDPSECIGCGLCDHACPVAPSAIPIRPAALGGDS